MSKLEHNLNFRAGGEPPTVDGPLQVRGNMEIISGTGRVVARVESAKLCRCGGSKTKPFCDGTHAQIGFKS